MKRNICKKKRLCIEKVIGFHSHIKFNILELEKNVTDLWHQYFYLKKKKKNYKEKQKRLSVRDRNDVGEYRKIERLTAVDNTSLDFFYVLKEEMLKNKRTNAEYPQHLCGHFNKPPTSNQCIHHYVKSWSI